MVNVQRASKADKLTIRLTKDTLVAAIFFLYFCSDVFLSLFSRVLGSSVFYMAYNIAFFGLIALYAATNHAQNLKGPIFCYFTIFMMFLITFLLHPEYDPYIFDQTYGIQVQMLRASGGIWAFLVISITTNREKLLQYLRVTVWIMFFFLAYRFVLAQRRGYWINTNNNFQQVEGSYNLGFGYSMMFCSLFFAGEAFLKNRKLSYIPFAISSLMVLIGGSRGAMIWIVSAFPFMMVYKWNNMNRRSKTIAIVTFLLVLPIFLLVYIYYEQLLYWFSGELGRIGFASRTLTSLLSGGANDTSGRDKIYGMILERIREGGLFGNGVYGERIVVAQRYRWGYSHNLFLELLAAFGYVGGNLIIALLVYNVVKTARNCRTSTDQIIFTVFLFASMKLMLSDSFWFNRPFWGLIALLVLWRRQDIMNHRRKSFLLRMKLRGK